MGPKFAFPAHASLWREKHNAVFNSFCGILQLAISVPPPEGSVQKLFQLSPNKSYT
jgi:hypothetical protein